MLTLTLAENNLELNSQCRCSVVAKGARNTVVYIGGGGGRVLQITRSWSQFYCAPLFLCCRTATKLQMSVTEQESHPRSPQPPPPAVF